MLPLVVLQSGIGICKGAFTPSGLLKKGIGKCKGPDAQLQGGLISSDREASAREASARDATEREASAREEINLKSLNS